MTNDENLEVQVHRCLEIYRLHRTAARVGGGTRCTCAACAWIVRVISPDLTVLPGMAPWSPKATAATPSIPTKILVLGIVALFLAVVVAVAEWLRRGGN